MPLFKGLLSFFTENKSVSTATTSQLIASGSETDINAVLSPKGNGAIISNVPDGTSAGGDARGTNAVDFQLLRSSAQQVATGARSFVTGSYNKATQQNTFVHGKEAVAGKYCCRTFSSGKISAIGDAQTTEVILKLQTNGNTQLELTLDGTAELIIPTDTTWLFNCMIVARRTDANNESAGWIINGVIDNNAGTTALVGSISTTTVADDSAGVWAVTAVADDSSDTLQIKITGESAKVINWVGHLRLVEVTG